MLKDAGADVEPGSQRVRFDPALVEAQDRARAEGIHPARAQPRAQSDDRRAPCRLRLGRERAQLLRSRRRPKARQSSRLPELHPPRADVRFDPFLGRLSGRAGRHPRLGPPSRRALRHADAVGQADPRLQPRARAQSRRDRDDQDRPRHRRCDARARAFAVHRHQFVLAAEARHADARGHHPDGAAQSGRRADPVHARGRDGAGDARRRARPAARRGAGRARHDPDRAAGRALRLRRLHLERRHEIRRARRSARPST